MTFSDLCRSNGGSYDFGAMETFNQHANMTVSVCRFSSKSHGGSFPIESFPYPDNGTFGDLCRSRSGSYDFGAIETFDQHAKFYQYAEFHQNSTGGTFAALFFSNYAKFCYDTW